MPWKVPPVDGLPPAPRGGHACVCLGSRVLLFGGADRNPTVFNDLWSLDTGAPHYGVCCCTLVRILLTPLQRSLLVASPHQPSLQQGRAVYLLPIPVQCCHSLTQSAFF